MLWFFVCKAEKGKRKAEAEREKERGGASAQAFKLADPF